MTRRWCSISAVIALTLALPASAQKPPEDAAKLAARTLANTGRQRFEAGDYAGALEALRDAEKYFHAPTITRMRALSHEKLGQLVEALELHKRVAAETLEVTAPVEFVKAQGDSAKAVTSLEGRIPKLQITLAHAPSGTRVTLDGNALDTAALTEPVRVNPGKHTLSIEPPGAAKVTRDIELEEQATGKVDIDLAPSSSPAITASPTASSAPSSDKETPPAAGKRSFVGPAVAFGIGGASLIAGAITGGLTLAKAGQVRSICGSDLICPESDRAKVDIEGAKNIGYVSTATFALAGASAVVGVVLLLLPAGKKSEPKAAVTFGPTFVGVKGAF